MKLQESKHECIPIGQMVFSDYTKRRILLLRERGKTYERNFGTAAEERYSNESSRDFEVFIEVQAKVYTIVRKKGGGCAAKNRLIKSTKKHAV